MSNQSGGLRQDSAYLDNLDLTLGIDTEALWNWTGTELFFYGLYNNGTRFSDTIVGDLQIVSNIETGVQAVRLYEAWFRFRLGRRSEMLVGLYDLNSEFDVLSASTLFIGSAHGIGTDIAQAGVNGPSIFPVTGLTAKLEHDFDDHWTLRGAAIDGVPGDPENPDDTDIQLSSSQGALLIGEVEWSKAGSRVLAGLWGYTATFDQNPLDLEIEERTEQRGNSGVYLRGETTVLDVGPTVAVFGRIGYANGDFNVFDVFVSAGFTAEGLVQARPDDRLGLAFAWAETSTNVKELADRSDRLVDSREVAIEFTYRASLGERFVIQPSLQYVINPGIDPAIDNATVVGVRFEVSILD